MRVVEGEERTKEVVELAEEEVQGRTAWELTVHAASPLVQSAEHR